MNEKNADDRPTNILDQINQVCRAFGKQFSQGKSPRIESYLSHVPKEAQENLFASLIGIEVNYRQRVGETPTSNEYIKRFPQFKTQVHRAFFEPTIDSANSEARTDSEHQTESLCNPTQDVGVFEATHELTDADCLGDFELLRELGRGAFGIVYEAKHKTRGNRVALKTLPTGKAGENVSPERLHRFRREFRSLSEINHPNLVGMQTLEVDDGNWFLTMDLVEGTDFLSHVRPDGCLNEERLRAAISELVEGIVYLHEHGIIHRDLKPSNVLVDADARVVVLDFGLVAQLQQAGEATMSRSGMFAGTPRYAAPEQMFGERSEASDWYALGTMVYEALTGNTPFGGTPMQVLRRKQEEVPDQLTSCSEYPQDLATLVDGLLNRDPQLRPTTEAILEALQIDHETRFLDSTHGSDGSSTARGDDELDLRSVGRVAPNLIGRDEQLRQLEVAKDKFQEERKSMIVWITGKSGEGKSSLAQAFLRPVRQSDEMVILEGRCYDRESVPYKAIDCWVDSLSSFLSSYPKSRLKEILPQDTSFLAQLFPAMRLVPQIASMPSINSTLTAPESMSHRAFGALKELLANITQQTPLILFVDDLQWGDADSVAVFRRLMSPPNSPHLMVLGGYRSDERDSSEFLNGFARETIPVDQTVIEVGPLSEQEAFKFFASETLEMSPATESEVRRAYRETAGNPYFMRQLVDNFDRNTGTFETQPLDAMIRERLLRLPPEAKRLLEMVSIFGRPVTASEATELAGVSGETHRTLTRMRNEKLIRTLGSGSSQRVDTIHDKIRETICEAMSPKTIRDWHLRIAETIERMEELSAERLEQLVERELNFPEDPCSCVPRVFDLAYHFGETEDPRSFVYQLLAGEESQRSYALEDSLRHFEKAEKNVREDTPAATQYRLWAALGLAHSRLRNSESTIACYRKALAVAPTNFQRANAYYGEACIHIYKGESLAAEKSLDLALREIGKRRPTTRFGNVVSAAWCIAQLLVVPHRWLRSKGHDAIRRARFERDIVMRFGNFSWEIDLSRSLQTGTRHAVLSLRSGEEHEKAEGLSLGAAMLAEVSLRPLARICMNWSLRQKSSKDEPENAARTHFFRSLYYRRVGQAASAERELEAAYDIVMKCGSEDIAFGIFFLRRIAFEISSSAREQEWAQRLFDYALQLNDVRGMRWGYHGNAVALARAGDLSAALRQLTEAKSLPRLERSYSSDGFCLGDQGYVFLQCSNYPEAARLSSDAWSIVRRHSLYHSLTTRSLSLLIHSQVGPNWLVASRSLDASRLRKLCRWARWLSRIVPNERAYLLRARARGLRVLGQMKKSERCFEAAIRVDRKLEAKYSLALSLLDVAAVKEEGRDENRAEAIQLLKKMESVIPRAESWLLGDQHDEEVVAPEFDLAAWEKEHGPITSEQEED